MQWDERIAKEKWPGVLEKKVRHWDSSVMDIHASLERPIGRLHFKV